MSAGMNDLLALEKAHLWHPFTPMAAWCADGHEPLRLVSGRGCTLTDQHGREYLDGNASIWTNVHGHAHPTINAAIVEQLQRVAHTSFLGFTHEPAIRLAKALVDLFPGEKLTRCSTRTMAPPRSKPLCAWPCSSGSSRASRSATHCWRLIAVTMATRWARRAWRAARLQGQRE